MIFEKKRISILRKKLTQSYFLLPFFGADFFAFGFAFVFFFFITIFYSPALAKQASIKNLSPKFCKLWTNYILEQEAYLFQLNQETQKTEFQK
jgi:hypothetical protein